MSKKDKKVYNVLFLCEHNAARSVLAECALRRWANGRFAPFSAGREAAAEIHPHTLKVLKSYNFKTDGLTPKSWDVFMTEGAPQMDFVFTVFEPQPGETLPTFPGNPMVAHWPIENPSLVAGTEERQIKAFRRAYIEIETRCKIFSSLRVAGLDKLTLQSSLDLIGTHRVGEAADTAA